MPAATSINKAANPLESLEDNFEDVKLERKLSRRCVRAIAGGNLESFNVEVMLCLREELVQSG